MEWWKEPFFQVALPIIVTFAIATWFQGKRIDDVIRRLEHIGQRLDRIETSLLEFGREIAALKERTSLIR